MHKCTSCRSGDKHPVGLPCSPAQKNLSAALWVNTLCFYSGWADLNSFRNFILAIFSRAFIFVPTRSFVPFSHSSCLMQFLSLYSLMWAHTCCHSPPVWLSGAGQGLDETTWCSFATGWDWTIEYFFHLQCWWIQHPPHCKHNSFSDVPSSKWWSTNLVLLM